MSDKQNYHEKGICDMDLYRFDTLEPVGSLRAARRLDEQSIPQQEHTLIAEESIALSETVNTIDLLEEIGKRLLHIEISDQDQSDCNKIHLVFDNGEEYEVNLSKVDNKATD